MPLVRIDHPAILTATEAAAISQAVHVALIQVFGVPADDLFQVVARRAPGEMVVSPQYLGIRHSDLAVFVQIACSPGRSVGLKEELYARIAAGVAAGTRVPADDVIINLVETVRDNWSFGAGIAHYAVRDRARPASAS